MSILFDNDASQDCPLAGTICISKLIRAWLGCAIYPNFIAAISHGGVCEGFGMAKTLTW